MPAPRETNEIDKMVKRLMAFAMDSDFYSCITNKADFAILKATLDAVGLAGLVTQDEVDSWD